jgi:hypothetical protein
MHGTWRSRVLGEPVGEADFIREGDNAGEVTMEAAEKAAAEEAFAEPG